MPYFEELPLSAQTAYAQLLDSALSADHLRSIADLPGSFAQKTVKWTSYWYHGKFVLTKEADLGRRYG
jgi:hypothetical protein